MISRILGIIGIIILGTMGLGFIYAVVIFISNTALEWANKAAHYFLDVKAKNQQIKLDAIKRMMPDENTRQGVVWDGKSFRNLDNGHAFTMLEDKYLDPLMWKVDKIQQTLLAMKGVNFPQEQLQELIEPIQSVMLPNRISCDRIL